MRFSARASANRRARRKSHPSHFLTSLSELKQDDYRRPSWITASAFIAASNFSKSRASKASFFTWNMPAAIGCICRWTASTWCRNTSAATAQRRRSTVWAARLGKKSRPKRANRFSPWPKSWSNFTPCAKRARAPALRRRTICTRNSKRASNTRKLPTNSARSTKRWRACKAKNRWTGWFAATSVTARPKSPCARRFSPSKAASRSRVLAPTTILAQQHLQTFRHRFRNHPVRVEMVSRFLTGKEIAAGLARTRQGQRSISSSARIDYCKKTSSSKISVWSSSTKSTASAWSTRSG